MGYRRKGNPVNVGQLRKAIAELPDTMPVVIQSECGWSDTPNLYLEPAHIEGIGHRYVSDGHRDPETLSAWYRGIYGEPVNTTALLISEWGSDGVDITPDEPNIIDGQTTQTELPAGKANQ